jgi:hypothetical protein
MSIFYLTDATKVFVRSDVYMVINPKIAVFCDVMPSSSVERYCRLGESCCCNPLGLSNNEHEGKHIPPNIGTYLLNYMVSHATANNTILFVQNSYSLSKWINGENKNTHICLLPLRTTYADCVSFCLCCKRLSVPSGVSVELICFINWKECNNIFHNKNSSHTRIK